METLYVHVNSKRKSDESVINNQIDDEVQQIFHPLNFMQIVLLNPKYYTKNNFILPNNFFNKFVLTIGVLTFLVAHLYEAYLLIVDFGFSSPLVFIFTAIFGISYQCVEFIMNFIIHLSHTKESVSFVLRLQEVHRFLNNKVSRKRFIITSWMYVGTVFGFYFIMSAFIYLVSPKHRWNVVFWMMGMACFDANVIYVMRSIKLLTDKSVLWNTKLLFAQKNGCNNLLIRRLLWTYNQILNCYQLATNIYKIPMLFKIVGSFIEGLLYIQYYLESFKLGLANKTIGNQVQVVFVSFWVVKNLVIQMSLSLHLEAFYEAVQHAQNSCEFILVSSCSDDEKKLCKNVLRLHRASFSKMSVCGLFYIDVCHLLQFISIFTHYIIVLLQFAFL